MIFISLFARARTHTDVLQVLSYGLTDFSMNISPSPRSFPHFSFRDNSFFVIIQHGRRYSLFHMFFMSLVRCNLSCEAFHGHFIKMFKLSVLRRQLQCLFFFFTIALTTYTQYTMYFTFLLIILYPHQNICYRIEVSIDFSSVVFQRPRALPGNKQLLRNEFGTGTFTVQRYSILAKKVMNFRVIYTRICIPSSPFTIMPP